MDSEGPCCDLRLTQLVDASKSDVEYQELVRVIRDGFPNAKFKLRPGLQMYWNGREHLSVDNDLVLKGTRIVVPRSLRHQVLENLHASHQGLVHTKRRARQVVYWPGMNAEIDKMIRQCEVCRTHVPSQPKEPLLNDRIATLPFESVSADLFNCQGFEYLVYADRLTGWICLAKVGRTASSPDVIRHIRRWFPDVGVPKSLCTDGGPQFASRKFADFCKKWQVTHIKSTPHYPQSNGHAEAAVKAMKQLIFKTTKNGDLDVDSFQRGLLEWRNTPRASGDSPAEALYGRSLDSFVLAHRRHFSTKWKEKFEEMDKTSVPTTHCDRGFSRPLRPIKIGTHVDVQHPDTKLWSA